MFGSKRGPFLGGRPFVAYPEVRMGVDVHVTLIGLLLRRLRNQLRCSPGAGPLPPPPPTSPCARTHACMTPQVRVASAHHGGLLHPEERVLRPAQDRAAEQDAERVEQARQQGEASEWLID